MRAFEELAAKARKLGKSIAVLKVGKSVEARKAAQSHTASLAGDAQGAKSLFKRLGIAEVDRLEVLVETLKIFHLNGPLFSKNVRSLSCSGGEASLVSDLGQEYGIHFPKLEKEKQLNLAFLRVAEKLLPDRHHEDKFCRPDNTISVRFTDNKLQQQK